MFRSSPTHLRCSRSREWVSLALDDLLDEARRIELTEHLGSCADCRTHQAVLEQGRAALQATLAEPSENFEWKVQLGIQRALRERAAAADRPAGSFWKPALASAAGVAVLVVGLGSWWLVDQDSPVPTSMRVPRTATQPTTSLVVEAQLPAAAPDLSGAVPGRVFEYDATRDGFGIRTVSRTTSDPRFSGDLYAPMRDASGQRASGEADRNAGLGGRTTIQWHSGVPQWQLRGDGVQVLNLRLRGSTLPTIRSTSGSSPESTVTTAAPR